MSLQLFSQGSVQNLSSKWKDVKVLPGAWACICKSDDKEHVLSGTEVSEHVNDARIQLMATVRGLEFVENDLRIHKKLVAGTEVQIHTSSEAVLYAIAQCLQEHQFDEFVQRICWEKKPKRIIRASLSNCLKGSKKQDLDLRRSLRRLLDIFSLSFTKVNAHARNPAHKEYARCRELSRQLRHNLAIEMGIAQLR